MIFNSVLITGGVRGIGLQFVKDFLKLGNAKVSNVIATYRDPSTLNDLNELAKSNKNLNILQLDLKNYSQYDSFRDQVNSIVGDKGLSLLVNNAGVANKTSINDVTVAKMLEDFEVNAVAQLMLSKSLLPLLKKSSKGGNRTVIANISSVLASIGSNSPVQGGSLYAYRVSKTALNQISRSLSFDLKRDKILVAAIHPGWVKTRMGTDKAPLTPDQSVSKMIELISDSSRDISGKFFNYDGTEIPW